MSEQTTDGMAFVFIQRIPTEGFKMHGSNMQIKQSTKVHIGEQIYLFHTYGYSELGSYFAGLR
jgi:hypothetical protein